MAGRGTTSNPESNPTQQTQSDEPEMQTPGQDGTGSPSLLPDAPTVAPDEVGPDEGPEEGPAPDLEAQPTPDPRPDVNPSPDPAPIVPPAGTLPDAHPSESVPVVGDTPANTPQSPPTAAGAAGEESGAGPTVFQRPTTYVTAGTATQAAEPVQTIAAATQTPLRALYRANQGVIEAAARANGYADSDGGRRLFGNLTLTIPQTYR